MNKFWKYIKTYRKSVAIVVILTFFDIMMEFYLPNLMAKIVNNGIIMGDQNYIIRVGLRMIFVALLGSVCMIVSAYYSSKAAMGFSKDLRRDVFTHINKFSIGEFNDMGTSSLITRTTNDVSQIQSVFLMFLRMMLRAPLMLVGGLIMAISKSGSLSMVLGVSVPVLVGSVLIVGALAVPIFKVVQEKIDGLNLVLREKLTGVRVIRAFNKDNYEMDRFDDRNKSLSQSSLKVDRLIQMLFPLINLILNFTVIGILWFGSKQVAMENMYIGDIMAFIQYIMMIMFSLLMFSAIFIVVPRAAASGKRIMEVMEIEPSIVNEKNTQNLDTIDSIEFRDVSFSYPDAENDVLCNLNFAIEKNETMAIIGGTGSGKTTLINLIPRFYDITGGEILINGKNIKSYKFQDIRKHIGFVPQKSVLFSGTVEENIRVGKRDATMEEMERAARISQAEDFIESLDGRYNGIISQGGKNLSGGQKQRLAIARALVREAKLYIFDDSFSALDFKTDAKLRKALREEVGQSMKIVVGQRVSSIKDADNILVLDNGRMVGLGSHDYLLENCEVYREIVKSQTMDGENNG